MRKPFAIALGFLAAGIFIGYLFGTMAMGPGIGSAPEYAGRPVVATAGGLLSRPGETRSPAPSGDVPKKTPAYVHIPDFAFIAAEVAPAVVHLTVERIQPRPPRPKSDDEGLRDWFFGGREGSSNLVRSSVEGTGFFIDPDGHILTDFHVVQDAALVIATTSDGREYADVRVVGVDQLTDLALLKADAREHPHLTLGDSTGLRVGEYVLAIGSPYGLTQTVTLGICSAKGRQIGNESFQSFIQTDAAINQGNSGGPLLNGDGVVIGINASILTPGQGNVGIGFAIPSEIAQKVVAQLQTTGRVRRGWLGETAQNVTPAMVSEFGLPYRRGAIVASVFPGSPAERAGLQTYDVIVGYGQERIWDRRDLGILVAETSPGTRVPLAVLRDGREIGVEIVLEEILSPKPAPPREGNGEAAADIGIEVGGLTPAIARRLGVAPREGLIIVGVRQGSEAARVGLEPGMIILEANRKRIRMPGDLQAIWKTVPSGRSLVLLVRSGDDGAVSQSIVSLRKL